jgi:hypothetical protein
MRAAWRRGEKGMEKLGHRGSATALDPMTSLPSSEYQMLPHGKIADKLACRTRAAPPLDKSLFFRLHIESEGQARTLFLRSKHPFAILLL